MKRTRVVEGLSDPNKIMLGAEEADLQLTPEILAERKIYVGIKLQKQKIE